MSHLLVCFVRSILALNCVRPGLHVKSDCHVRQIVLKNVIYLQVQNIHTYPLCKTT